LISLVDRPVYLFNGDVLCERSEKVGKAEVESLMSKAGLTPEVNALPTVPGVGTMSYGIIDSHDTSDGKGGLRLRFDKLTSHDITYVGVVQTAIACGLTEFPVPYVLTNCHNSLCAVGGTINEDDHVFGLSACRKFGGEYVPAHVAVIHQYMREMMAESGAMILGTDSHTRYGALGTLAVGEGGPELVKQLLGRTYDMARPGVVCIYLKGAPRPGVGPQDVALAIIGAVFENGFVKNKAMEFVGPGVGSLSVDFRLGIDVMTTETACWSSIWRTDEPIKEFYGVHGRPEAYKRIDPDDVALYDGAVVVDLDKVEPMIALPYHPSNAVTIREFVENPVDMIEAVETETARVMENSSLRLGLMDKLVDGRFTVDQGIIAGCSGGTFENVVAASQILDGADTGAGEFSLSVYPASQPVNMELVANGSIGKLMAAGAIVKTAFCGPCFGAGDTPCHRGFSIRHTTRNFPNREGSKPGEGQISAVALMDSRSIAATAANGGILTPGTEFADRLEPVPYRFDGEVYDKRVYRGVGRPHPEEELVYGPNIKPWPEISPLPEDQLLFMAAVIEDPVTTTDELIPSGETSSLRSNPMKLAEFTLSRKEPRFVGRAKVAQALEDCRKKSVADGTPLSDDLAEILSLVGEHVDVERIGIGSAVFAVKPGDGSAREQAASSQKMLGGQANVAVEFATKRYRSNLINWGMVPYVVEPEEQGKFRVENWLYVPGIRRAVKEGATEIQAFLLGDHDREPVTLKLVDLEKEDRDIILSGCLMNYYRDCSDRQ